MSLNPTHKTFDIKAAKMLNPVFIKRFGLENNPPFNLDPASDEFAWKVFEFQLEDKQIMLGLPPLVDDGLFGPKALQAYKKVFENKTVDVNASVDYLFFDGKQLSINAKVISPGEPGGMAFEDITSKKCFSTRKNLSKAKIIATHHDAAISPVSTFKILVERGLSTGFNIDYDGTIYQYFKDPSKYVQWATGAMNSFSIPFDVNTPAIPEYAYLYKKRGITPPPIIIKKCNGETKKVLSLFPAQQKAAEELIRVLCKYLQIPIRIPRMGGEFLVRQDAYVLGGTKQAPISKFHEEGGGIVGHFHCSKQKFDPIMLDFLKIEQIKL